MPSFNPSASAHYSQYSDFSSSRFQQRPSAYDAFRSNGYNTYANNSVNDLNAVLPDPYQYKAAGQDTSLKVPSQNRFTMGPSAAQGLVAGAQYPVMQPLPNPWSDYNSARSACSRRRQDTGYYQEQQQQHQQQQQPKEEKPVGGVSATLDYDMEQMTSFVAQMAEGIVRPSAATNSEFRKWVLQVLNATRLPSATILLSLSYMQLRVKDLSASSSLRITNRTAYSMLTVALILGSKFLDDNTFQNKSWAEVSNIPTEELNRTEREWLIDFNHRLHYEKDCPDGFDSWEKKWKEYRAASATAMAPTVPHKLNTDLGFQYNEHRSRNSPYQSNFVRSATSTFSSEEGLTDSAYPAPYTPYDAWYGNPRSAMDRSPASAPHSGPHTPEYYGHQNLWGPVDAFSRRGPYYASNNYGYPTSANPRVSSHNPSVSAWGTGSGGATGQTYWNCHGAACQCSNCRQTNMMSRYGPIVCG